MAPPLSEMSFPGFEPTATHGASTALRSSGQPWTASKGASLPTNAQAVEGKVLPQIGPRKKELRPARQKGPNAGLSKRLAHLISPTRMIVPLNTFGPPQQLHSTVYSHLGPGADESPSAGTLYPGLDARLPNYSAQLAAGQLRGTFNPSTQLDRYRGRGGQGSCGAG